MEFKLPYVLAMREQDPKEFMALRGSGKLDQHLQEKSAEAHRMLEELLRNKPRDSHGFVAESDLQHAEELVRAALIEFPETARRRR